MNRTIAALMLCAAAAILSGCSGDISEPWVSGQQAQALEDERTRSTDVSRELAHRLERYASPYR
jgi:hypothetical protein